MTDYFLVLQSSPEDKMFIHILNKYIESMATILRSVFLYEHSERRSKSVTEHFWREQTDDGVTVSLVDDLEMPARLLYVAGGDPTQRELTWKNLKVMLPVSSVDELRQSAQDPESDPGALQRLALGLNDRFDLRTQEIIARALENSSLEVRMSAAVAAAILKWVGLIPPLASALALETSDQGRNVLSHVIRVCRSENKSP